MKNTLYIFTNHTEKEFFLISIFEKIFKEVYFCFTQSQIKPLPGLAKSTPLLVQISSRFLSNLSTSIQLSQWSKECEKFIQATNGQI